MTQEEFDARHANWQQYSEWMGTWKAFHINTNTPESIRVIVIDGQIWFMVKDIARRLGFAGSTEAVACAQKQEKLLLRGVRGFPILSDTPQGLAMCNVVNVYGLMRIIEVVKNYKEPTGGGRRRKLPTEEYVRFASWLERITIPRAEAKAKDAPTLNDTRRQRMKVRTSNVAVQPAPIANQPQAEPTYPTVEEFHERINKLTNGQIDAILATAKCNAEIDGTLTAQAEDAPVQLPVMLTRNHIEDVLQVILDDINAAEEHPGLLTTYGPAIPKVPTTELLEVWLTRVLYDAYVHGMNGTIPDYWKNYERELDPDWKQLKLLAEKFNVELTEVA